MIHQRKKDSPAQRTRRGCDLAAASWVLAAIFLLPMPVQGKTIFDDDWTPPKSDTPVQPPAQTSPPTQPVTPPESRKPETVFAPPPPPTVTVPAHRPIPAKADQAKSRKLFKEFYATELANRSAAARRALATKLLDQAGAVSDAPADQFVLLVGATEAAREASDLALVSRAADALADAYEVDGLHVKSDAATQMALRADSPVATTENCRNGIELVDQLAAAADFVTAQRLLKSLQAAAPDTGLRLEIQKRAKEIDARKTAADRMAMFSQKLKTAPDDPVANLAVGQHLCFVNCDWAHGLPLLAKGSDATSKNLAAQELKNPTEAEGRLAVADGWWAYSDTQHDPEKTAIQSHARDYYRTALPGLTGLAKLKAETRLPEPTRTQTPALAIRTPAQPVDGFIELLPHMRGGIRGTDGVVSVTGGASVHTADSFKPPVAFHVVAQTSLNNLRLSYGSMKIIFDREEDTSDLRIDAAPAGVHHKKGAGFIPPGTWAIIDLIVEPDKMTISVDGRERYRTDANFSAIDEPFGVFTPKGGSVVLVKSVEVRKPRRETETVKSNEPERGLIAELYRDEDFTALVKKRIDRQIYFDWQKLGPDPAVGGEKFSIRWTGLLRVSTTGTYTLFSSVDDEVEIWIDNKSVLSQHKVADSAKAEVSLAAGLHPIRIDYRNTGAEGHLLLQWEQENGFARQCLRRDVLCHDLVTAANAEPAEPGWRSEMIYTGRGGTPFREAAPANTMLVGFELTKYKPHAFVVVKSFRAIYRGPTGETLGTQIGEPEGDVVRLVAKPGYAVGMIHATYGLRIDRVSLHFMRLDGGTLDPSDSYDSPDFGGGGGKVTDAGEGKPIIGIYGVVGQNECCSLGVITRE